MNQMSSKPSDPNPVDTARPRGQIWILVAVFFAPLVIAFILYYGVEGWMPSGQTNHGELIHPPRPVPAASLPSIDGELPASTWKGKWTLVYVGSGTCDARCREALILMRQTRLALNDDLPRVQRLFLATDHCCDQPYLQAEHAGLLIGKLDEASAAEVSEVFQNATPEPLADAGRIYIVDPLGNLMMSYPREAEPKGLLVDLKKLLKLSHIG
jgi:cytochrome oxidase Cu insertion factor (SCO1/SenC/PrrC family)